MTDQQEPDTPYRPVPPAPSPSVPLPSAGTELGDYTNAGVPTLEHLRDKIEGRAAVAMGSAELAQESAPGQDMAQAEAAREKAAQDKLEQIRRSLHPEGGV